MAQPTGASGTDPNAPQSGAPGTGDGTGATGASGTPDPAAVTPPANAPASGQTYTQAEYDAAIARMKAADQRASAKEQELRQLVDKDLPEMDKLRKELDETKAREAAASEASETLRIENAFLKDNTFTWQNPATALKLLDRSKITVDPSSGEISGMKAALEALSKSDAYLLKPAAPEGEGGNPTPPLGTPPANGGAGATSATTKAAMEKRFPASRGRG